MNKSYIMSVVQSMADEREKARIAPTAVLLLDILNRVVNDAKCLLWELCKDGALEMHQTLNTTSFEPKTEKI